MWDRNRVKGLVRWLTIGGILAPMVLFSSCVYDKDMGYLNDQVIALNRRVAKLEEAMDKRLSTIRTSQEVELDQIRGEVQKLSGRTEDNERILKRTVERDLGDQDTARKGMTELTQKVSDLERVVRAQQEYLGLESLGPKDKAAEERVTPVPGQPVQPPTAPPVAAQPAKPKDAELYDSSLASYRAGKYEDALLGFKDYVKKYPKSERGDSAQFWVGECYMALKQYEQAILAFQEVVKKYPKGSKVPNALLRQSMAFLEIKDKTSSKLLLRKIVKEYPNSSEAKIAAKKLETIK